MNRKKVSAAAIWHGLTAETFLYRLTGWQDERDRIPAIGTCVMEKIKNPVMSGTAVFSNLHKIRRKSENSVRYGYSGYFSGTGR